MRQGPRLISLPVIAGLIVFLLAGCAGPTAGPDKQGFGLLRGAATGAGAGAITGAQLSAGTGPGAAVGAGFGAVAGGIAGFAQDQIEESVLKLAVETKTEREISFAHEVLAEHYRRRMELHPTRDIFPADVFFFGDESKVRKDARAVVKELARLNKDRLPWSRFVVAAYVKSGKSENNTYAQHLASERARILSDLFVNAGLEPRRMIARAVIIDEPLVIDPQDDPLRYNQAIEFIPIDR